MANKMRTGRLALAGVIAATTLVATTGCVVVVGGRGGHWDDDDYVVEYRQESRVRPQIGVTTSGLSESLATQLQVDPRQATLITGVYNDTPAMNAGIRQWDVIVAVNGDDDASPDRLRHAITSTDTGDTVVLELVREGESIEIEVEPELRGGR